VIDDYLRRLRVQARRRSVDEHRLVAELADHLHEASAAYVSAGWRREDGESLAIRDLGDPDQIVSAVAHIGGGVMRERTRLLGIAAGAIALIALWVSHIVPPSDITGSPFATVILVAAMVTGVSAVALASTTNAPLAFLIAITAGAGAWAIATSATERAGVSIVSGGHMLTLGATAVAFLLVGLLMKARAALGVAILAAGIASLVLNHGGYGGMAAGHANLGLGLMTAGWLWMAGSLGIESWAQQHVSRAKGMVAGWLESTARRLAPPEAR
jgi:hypothetical protein